MTTDAHPQRVDRLNLRVLRFRSEPAAEEPALLAQALIDSGRFAEAIELTDAALAREGADADLWLAHGVALARTGQLERAQLAVMHAARDAPDWIEPWRALAEILLGRQRPERALAVAERGLAIDPEHVALRALKRSALLSLRVAEFVREPNADEPAMLAEELIALGRANDAFEVTRAALLTELDDADLLVTHARAALARGDAEDAESALETACVSAPDWAEPWRQLARVRSERGDVDGALDAIARALLLDPSDDDLVALYQRLCAARVPHDAEVDRLLEDLAPAR